MSALILTVITFFAGAAVAAKWNGRVAPTFDRSELWIELVGELRTQKMHYGAVAGSQRVLEYFNDIKSKQLAFETIVGLIDFGYPFSLRPVFMAGDLELSGKDAFSQSYNLYKATLDLEKNMPKWAETYFSRLDGENFPKYQFYLGLKAFNEKNPEVSLQHLDKTLSGLTDPKDLSLSKKAARTMARIYYEQGRYKESLDIYQTYLLKMNPLEPADWIEASWNLYRLGRLDEALGYLYNLEQLEKSQNAGGPGAYLEKYIIRALIFREQCATDHTKRLGQDFEAKYGETLSKIKMGEALTSLPQLQQVLDRNSEHWRVLRTLHELQEEMKLVGKLPGSLRPVAEFLYNSEIAKQQKLRNIHADIDLSNAARNLVIMGESLRFLQFDVVREQYNPDKVFAPPAPVPDRLVEDLPDNRFLLHWRQWGDFWRDERTLYRGILRNRCE